MRNSGYARNANDFYVEPRWIVDALLDVEPFTGLSLDPACGSGTIPKALRARGIACFGSDIADRGYTENIYDFFSINSTWANIISNPPYDVLQEWVDRALTLTTNKVAVIARLAFLESAKRKAWFQTVPLARVWVSSKRVSMPPGGTDVKASGGSIAYAWFVFEHGHVGAPTIGWLG